MWESTPRNSVFCSTMLNNEKKKIVSFETRKGFQFLVFLSFWIQTREIEACKMCHFFLFSFWMQFSRHFLFIVPYLRFKWHEWTSQPTRCNERYGTKFKGYAVSLQINIYIFLVFNTHKQNDSHAHKLKQPNENLSRVLLCSCFPFYTFMLFFFIVVELEIITALLIFFFHSVFCILFLSL